MSCDNRSIILFNTVSYCLNTLYQEQLCKAEMQKTEFEKKGAAHVCGHPNKNWMHVEFHCLGSKLADLGQ